MTIDARPRQDLADAFQDACFRRGLLVLECGRATVRLSPPLVVDAAEVATAVRIAGAALAELAGAG